MHLNFDARIDGTQIPCTITSDVALAAPVWCFSLMAVGDVVSGGILTRSVAGYCEVTLPDLAPGQPHRVVLAHAERGYRPVNRAWLPLGGYLRLGDGRCHPLPVLPAGVIAGPPPPAPDWPGLRMIPQPAQWVPGHGPNPTACHADAPAFQAAGRLAARTGLPALTGGVPVHLTEDPALPPGGYRAVITPDAVHVSHAGRDGAFYAAITLMTLLQTHGHLPCGTITDAPRFGWRGQHLDCARHFFGLPTILRLLDLMALLKLNRFHWHFADDESFRLETESAPVLWQQSAVRGEGQPIPGVFGGGIRAGGTYSRADVATVLAHAADLGIAILPEVEIPAHAFAINAILPGLRDPGDTGAEASVQGYPRNVLNPAMSGTWDLILPLVTEVAMMFPLGLIHLGCDELPAGAWEGSPAVAALKQQENLHSRDDVQGWMMHKVAGALAADGIRSAAWEEAAKGVQGIGHNALLFSWTGQGPGIAAARAGYDVVMCPAQHTYLDMAHTGAADDWGAAWAAIVSLEDTVQWHPVPPEAPDIAPHIVGVQGCFWAEFTTTDAQMEPMLAPRILGIAAKAWEAEGQTDGSALRAIAAHYGGLFDAMGWAWNQGA